VPVASGEGRVLHPHPRKHWPQVKGYGDITTVTGEELEPVDLICGGFLAISQSGRKASRHRGLPPGLWFEFARLVGELRPRYVLIENVPGLLFQTQCDEAGELARLGYVGCWRSLRAAEGASHLRSASSLWPTAAEQWAMPARVGSTGGRHQNSGTPGRGNGRTRLRTRCTFRYPDGLQPAQRTRSRNHPGATDLLTGAEELGPRPRTWRRPGSDATSTQGANLKRDAEIWQIPAARDWKSGTGSENNTYDKTPNLSRQVCRLSPQDPQIPDGSSSSESARTSRRRLNPRFVEFLMGLPIGWTEL
jgi:hypothetical protein